MDNIHSDSRLARLRPGVISYDTLQEQRLDYQLRTLELVEMLHRKLDLDLLLEAFHIQTQALVAFDGLEYEFEGLKHCVMQGGRRQHHLSFDLALGERALGTMHFYRSRGFSAREERELERLALHLVYPIRNALEYRRVIQRTLISPVTGLENRLAFERYAPREMLLSRRREQPLSLLLIDIDHFSAINEHHGREIGDKVLKAVALALSETLRKTDLLFHYDGDTFLILLNGTEYNGAKVLAERLRTRVNAGVSYDNVMLVLSASAGITEMVDQDEPETLVERARSALTHAKRAGRNTLRAVDRDPVSMRLV